MSDLITMMSAAAGQVGGINPREHFNTVLYTGNATARSITGVGFQPDFVWFKNRSSAFWHQLYDAVRGVSLVIYSNRTDAEANAGATGLTAFNSDGFSIGTTQGVNENGSAIVAWNWNAGGSNATNTDGTITSTVRANPTAGISVLTYTGTGSSASIGHGLGAAPGLIIIKQRGGTTSWPVWHQSFPSNQLYLNLTNALDTPNISSVGSSTFTVDTWAGVNASSGTYVAYCFAEIPGFSAFGSYTGNGSATGPSVTTNFEPTWLLIKRTDSTNDWILLDAARDATNPRTAYLEPNTADAEATGNDVDFNSTGFQLKSTSASINASGGTYIYACFA